NVGHLVIAAGATGVIKTALALAERRIPPSLHYAAANPAIDFARSPFVVNDRLHDWTSAPGVPRRAGVSSFGVGGTNAHVVLEEAPALAPSEATAGPQLLLLSARTATALGTAATRLGTHLADSPEVELADVAWTLAVGRKAFAHRLAVVTESATSAIALVARRGELMQAQPPGAMLSVRLPLDALQARLPADLALAAENAPGACVVAGPAETVEAFRAALEADGIAARLLQTSHAFHSAMMEPVLAPFREALAAVELGRPQLPLVSTALGDWLDPAQAGSIDYWTQHLRVPVRFSGALARVLDAPSRVLLEVGPRHTLTTLARQQLGTARERI